MIVRHPFERALSAYRDRILRKDSAQAIRHIPRIFIELQEHLIINALGIYTS